MPSFAADEAETQFTATTDVTYAYRRLGTRTNPPLLLANRFRGTMDHWDPALLDHLASERDTIIFDSAGVNQSTGVVPDTIAGMAERLFGFIEALGLAEVDLLGWSMGGMVALNAALARPALIRRIVIAASSPGPVPGTPSRSQEAITLASKPVNDDDDFLYLFFPAPMRRRPPAQHRYAASTPVSTGHTPRLHHLASGSSRQPRRAGPETMAPPGTGSTTSTYPSCSPTAPMTS